MTVTRSPTCLVVLLAVLSPHAALAQSPRSSLQVLKDELKTTTDWLDERNCYTTIEDSPQGLISYTEEELGACNFSRIEQVTQQNRRFIERRHCELALVTRRAYELRIGAIEQVQDTAIDIINPIPNSVVGLFKKASVIANTYKAMDATLNYFFYDGADSEELFEELQTRYTENEQIRDEAGDLERTWQERQADPNCPPPLLPKPVARPALETLKGTESTGRNPPPSLPGPELDPAPPAPNPRGLQSAGVEGSISGADSVSYSAERALPPASTAVFEALLRSFSEALGREVYGKPFPPGTEGRKGPALNVMHQTGALTSFGASAERAIASMGGSVTLRMGDVVQGTMPTSAGSADITATYGSGRVLINLVPR
jgi:hypothetical protein